MFFARMRWMSAWPILEHLQRCQSTWHMFLSTPVVIVSLLFTLLLTISCFARPALSDGTSLCFSYLFLFFLALSLTHIPHADSKGVIMCAFILRDVQPPSATRLQGVFITRHFRYQ